jgi:hypothetical protein
MAVPIQTYLPPTGVPPPPMEYTPEQKIYRFQQVCRELEINDYFASKIRQLENYEIVIIADDSGSMSSPIKPTGAFSAPKTRWDELKQTIRYIAEIACLMDNSGVDLYFLNRDPIYNLKHPALVLNNVFTVLPMGFTPLGETFDRVIREKRDFLSNKEIKKDLLVIMITDGQPTDNRGNVDIRGLYTRLHNRDSRKIKVSIVACTDDNTTMGYLNKWDHEINGLDVVDDFNTEKEQVIKQRGETFSFGDYVVKLMIGAIDPEIDRMDSVKGGCCIIG